MAPLRKTGFLDVGQLKPRGPGWAFRLIADGLIGDRQAARAALSFGIEGKFFPIANNGFFAMARPFEITILPGGGGTTPVLYGFGVGAGYAF